MTDKWTTLLGWKTLAATVIVVILTLTVLLIISPGRHTTALPLPVASTPTITPTTAEASPSPSSAATATAPPTVNPVTSAPDCITATLDGLSLPQRVGQLLMIGVAVDAPSGLQDSVARYHLGGVFLHGRSTSRAATLRSGITGLQTHADLPLLVSLDQEGGEVQTLKGPDFPLVPEAQDLGAEPTGTIRDTVADDARRLAGIGVNLNLAPVADTVPASIGKANPPIGAFHREYGNDPATVANAIKTIVPASQQAGVLTVVKHFPGLGRVLANTDTTKNAVDDQVTAGDPYLGPFETGVRVGTAGVMISSARYPKLDPDNVAAFSDAVITGLLRDKIGFKGLVLSDDLGAAVAVSDTPTGQRAVRFIAAGGDLVLSIRPPDAATMADALLDRARTDKTFAARVDDAVAHVLKAKQQAGLICQS